MNIVKEKPQAKATSFNPFRYKEGQRQQWNQVADGWREWWPLFEYGAAPLSKRLVELAQLQAGARVLDVATGVGEPAAFAAHHVGSTGHVVAIDQSAAMLAIGSERAQALDLPQLTFREMDAESLDFSDHSFDAILCRWGLMFLPNLNAALSEMRGLLKTNGYFVTAVWDVPSQVPMLSLPMRVVRQHIKLPPPAAGMPNPFNLADVEVFKQRLAQLGFVNVQSERQRLTWQFSSADQFVSMTRDLAAPVTALLANQSVTQQEVIWQAIGEAALQYAQEDGSLIVPSEAISIVAQRG